MQKSSVYSTTVLCVQVGQYEMESLYPSKAAFQNLFFIPSIRPMCFPAIVKQEFYLLRTGKQKQQFDSLHVDPHVHWKPTFALKFNSVKTEPRLLTEVDFHNIKQVT